MRGSKMQTEGAGMAVPLNSAITMARVSPPRKLFINESSAFALWASARHPCHRSRLIAARAEADGGVDGARTRDLRRDRPAF